MAPTVSVGAERPDTVARLYSVPQGLPSPAAPPAEFTQVATVPNVWIAVLDAE